MSQGWHTRLPKCQRFLILLMPDKADRALEAPAWWLLIGYILLAIALMISRVPARIAAWHGHPTLAGAPFALGV